MADLISYGYDVNSIFQLLGEKENDITLSLSWALKKCPEFLKLIVEAITDIAIKTQEVTIYNQKYDAETGITDIEITDNKNIYVIIEAKKGWILPSKEQIEKYSLRKDFIESNAKTKRIVTLSECTEDYANIFLPSKNINNIPVSHISWATIYSLAKTARHDSNNESKHLLDEFCEYLRGIMTMQKKDSNYVYVVALSAAKPDGCNISYIDIVKKHKKYFCPVGLYGWPKEPPNYIAFRYNGKLQSIHHIDNYTISRNMHTEIDDMPDEEWSDDCFIFSLGPEIVPSKTVKTGAIYRSGRVWAMLDLLLTCDTISEARDKSKER